MKFPRYSQSYQQDHIEKKSVDRLLIWRLLSYLLPYRRWLIFSLLVMIAAKGIDVFIPIFIGQITARILTNYDSSLETSIAFNAVFYSSMSALGLIFLSYFLEAVNAFIKGLVGQKALYTLRIQIFQHIQQLPVAYFDHHAVGRLITRTIHDVDQISQMFSEGVVPILGNFLLFIGMLIGIFTIDWQIGLAVCFVLPAVWWITHDFRVNQRYCYEMVRSIVSAMNAFIQENLMGMSTIRHFSLQKKERAKFEDLNRDHCQANLETIRHFSFFIAGIEFLQSFTLVLVFVILVLLAPPDTGFRAGTYFTFSIYAMMFFRPLGDLAERYNVLQSAMAAGERIFSILDEPTEPQGPVDHAFTEEIESIVFEDVWFAYEMENWVLKGVSFTISKGESIALVGTTGSGKTSIISLLLRLYEYQKGSIKINGRDIKEYSTTSLRKHFSVILQDPVIFSGTIADNVALYDPDITLDQIEASINYVHLRPLINRFPEKLKHRLKEKGTSLSLGEMQLISLARAVAHHRSVLILDEATANIDSASEKLIQEALQKILKKKTALVVAHRLSTIKDVNRILVVHQGAIVESGTHDQLIASQGFYEKLYRLQYHVG